MSGRHQRRRPSKTTTTKRIVWVCLINGIGWVWCSYALAFLGRTEIAESLSRTRMPVTILGVQDRFGSSAHSYEDALAYVGITQEKIEEAILESIQ